MSVTERLRAFDRRQQRGPRLGFPIAVIKKFADDGGSQLAGLIAFYGFLSLFPLLLVLVTGLGFVLQGDPGLREKILNGTLGQFPLISDQITHTGLKGSGVALAVGIVGSLWAGLGITNATQDALNRIWQVPFKHRPDFLRRRLRGLAMLALLGAMAILSTVAAGFVGATSHGAPAVVGGVIVAFLVNLALFFFAFKLLTAIDIPSRRLLPGVVVAAVGWQLLQHLGGFYLEHELKRTGPLYGVFALVLGLLAWLYLGAQLTLIAAEVNVVKARHLWPRSLFADNLIETDRRALTKSAQVEERVPQEDVHVSFERGQ